MVSEAEERRLRTIMYAGSLGWIFERNRDFLFKRLEGFSRAYTEKTQRVAHGHLPKSATVGDLVHEYDRNPHRVDALLQALAFNCSDEILAMIWAVLMGSKIQSLSFEYERRNTSKLAVRISFPDGTDETFVSTELWDAAALRLAGLSKADDKPLIESFYPLYVPRDGSDSFWMLRVLEWVANYHGSPPFCPSIIAPENVPEIANAIVDAVKRGWLEPQRGSRLEASRSDADAEAEMRALLAGDAALEVKLTPEGRRALRRGHFYRQLRPASARTLDMIKKEIERVLADPKGYTPEELEELRDELSAVDELLSEAG
jgi:hypothetical protein